jgi:hypothetical protein
MPESFLLGSAIFGDFLLDIPPLHPKFDARQKNSVYEATII